MEVLSPAQANAADLTAIARGINNALDTIVAHEDAFEGETLDHRLAIGREITKAQALFGMTNAQAAVLGGRAKAAVSRRDTAEPAVDSAGLTGWLKANIQHKKFGRSTALKYARAFSSLGLTETASDRDIKESVKKLRHEAGKAGGPMPTLDSLYKAAPKPAKTEALAITAPKDSKKLRLADAREKFHLWKETFEGMLKKGQLDDLDKEGLEDLKEFIAGARDRINVRLKGL